MRSIFIRSLLRVESLYHHILTSLHCTPIYRPVLGGMITSVTETIMTIIYMDIVATLISLGLLVFFMPESLPSKQSAHIRKLYESALETAGATDPSKSKKATDQQEAVWYSHFLRSLAFFNPRQQNINLILLGAISFLQTLAIKGTFSVLILYTNQIFHWTEKEDGILFSLGSLVRILSLLILLPVLVHVYQKRAKKRTFDTTPTATAAASTNINTKKPSYGPSSSSRNGTEQDLNENNNNNTNTINNIYPNNDNLGGFTSFEDPVIASSLEHLGEAVLNLSDDEESFEERRRRQSTVDSAVTWNSDRTRTNTHTNTHTNPHSPSSSSPSPKQKNAAPRTNEQVQSDLKLDTWIIRLGFIVNSITYVGYGAATQPWMFYLASALHATSIIASPSLKTLLTNLVEPSEFGAILGAIQVLDSVAGVVSPLVISGVYALTVKTRPAFVWYCCAILTGTCTILSFMIRQKQFVRRPSTASGQP